jgi:hypothetical protein
LKLINDKWATDKRWKKAETAEAGSSASTTSRWSFTDEKGQVWNGIVSLQPVGADAKQLQLTLKIVRSDQNASAQLK